MDISRDMLANDEIGPGDSLYSATRAFRLNFQITDGNLVLGVLDDRTLPRDSIDGDYVPMWDAGINLLPNVGTGKAIMQEDGNFVVYEFIVPEGSVPAWNSQTYGNPGAFLRCQDDGNLVVYSNTGVPLWSSNTYAGRR
jgi:hypothetical protein